MNEEQRVLATEDTWIEAEVAGDEAALRRVLHDDFVANSSDGTTSGKADVIAAVLAWNVVDQTLDERSVVVQGDTAVTFGTAEFRIATSDGEESTTRRRYTATYVRDRAEWRALALHMSARSGA